ncbi:MAG TPA: sigma-70 family RNA polymerase sigma factor [Vicinamibacterales bacterium]
MRGEPAMDLESSFELIQRAQQGDDDALNRLLERYLPRLRRWARGRLPSYARDLGDTNDLVQDVVTRTFRNFSSFEQRGEGALQAYLRQALMNRIRDEVRRTVRYPNREELDPELPGRESSPLEAAIGSEAMERYEHALARLHDVERQAVIARLELGYSYAEVAALVNKPTAGAARVAISRAVTKLARYMAQA